MWSRKHQIEFKTAVLTSSRYRPLSLLFALLKCGPLVRRQRDDRLMRKKVRQFLGAVTRTEDRATRLQGQPGLEAPGIDGVESEGVDQLKDRTNRGGIVAGGRHANAARRAAWKPALLQLEVTAVGEALHHTRG